LDIAQPADGIIEKILTLAAAVCATVAREETTTSCPRSLHVAASALPTRPPPITPIFMFASTREL